MKRFLSESFFWRNVMFLRFSHVICGSSFLGVFSSFNNHLLHRLKSGLWGDCTIMATSFRKSSWYQLVWARACRADNLIHMCNIYKYTVGIFEIHVYRQKCIRLWKWTWSCYSIKISEFDYRSCVSYDTESLKKLLIDNVWPFDLEHWNTILHWMNWVCYSWMTFHRHEPNPIEDREHSWVIYIHSCVFYKIYFKFSKPRHSRSRSVNCLTWLMWLTYLIIPCIIIYDYQPSPFLSISLGH